MSTLLLRGLVNVGVGLLLNFLFPKKQPDIVQEGPRLSDLTVTSSAYGTMIFLGYGTTRMSGNIIWSPGLEEVATTETQEGGGKGGGGGGSVTTTTYTYFASFAVSFAQREAQNILRIWADSKLIYDATGSGLVEGNVNFTFYTGSETQLPDPLMEANKGVGNVPAHRGICYMVVNRLALADFGNRIPNITAEIAFAGQNNAPFTGLTELGGTNIPGSLTGADVDSSMAIDPFTDELWLLKENAGGLARCSIATMTVEAIAEGPTNNSQAINFGMDGNIWFQNGGQNYVPVFKRNPTSFETTLQIGGAGATGNAANPFTFPNGVSLGVLRAGDPTRGVPLRDILVVSFRSIFADGGVSFYDVSNPSNVAHLGTDQTIDIGRGGPIMQDFFNRRLFFTQENNSVSVLYEVTVSLDVSITGSPSISDPTLEVRATLNKGGADLSGTSDVTGWVFLPDEEAIIVSNGGSMAKVDLNDGTVLATNLTTGFFSQHQWSNNGLFAFGNGAAAPTTDGVITTISTDSLAIVATQDIGLSSFGDGIESNYRRSAYDPRSHSLIFSRLQGAPAPSSNRIVRVLLSRASGAGENLSSVVQDLSERAGLEPTEIDVTDLVGQTLRGYAITRQISVRDAMEPLQRAFVFDGRESDFQVEFVTRGKDPILTIAEDEIGKRSEEEDDEPIKEIRAQEVEIPARVSVLYADLNLDYQEGLQHERRVTLPAPTQFSQEEFTFEAPLVFVSDEAKRLAQRLLYTFWAERVTIQSLTKWKFLKLDPADVVNLTFRGETRRLRMAEVDIGADLVVEFTATQEDKRTNDSDVPSDAGQGVPPQVIPSGLPTRLHLLDLPLLAAGDAAFQQYSRAYWAGAGYDATWPGTQLFQSRDGGSSFQELGATSVDVAWGVVQGAVPDPTTVFTWEDGVTLTLKVANGASRILQSTDDEVLSGANVLAVIRSDGLTELIQFVDVTQVDSVTFQVSRLLRGRRGTEENAFGHSSGETWVLLEAGRIFTFGLALADLNRLLSYRAVTLNTLIEDTRDTLFTYTGQDLTPYSVTQVEGTRNGSGDLTLTWVRRTRFNGELRDGTGTVPLNEQGELYDVEYYWDGQLILSRTDLTSPTDTLTAADFVTLIDPRDNTSLAEGIAPMRNRDFELNAAWTRINDWPIYVTQVSGGGVTVNPQSGSRYMFMGGQSGVFTSEFFQEVDLISSTTGWTENRLDSETPTVTINYWHRGARTTQAEPTRVIAEFRTASGAFISSLDTGNVVPGDNAWEQNSVSGPLPVGTRRIRTRFLSSRTGIGLDNPETCFDNTLLTVGAGVPPLTVRIYQKSAIVGRGRQFEGTF